MISVDTGSAVRAPRAVIANANTVSPTSALMHARSTRKPWVDRRSNRSGSRRSTSTNSTVDSVSIAAWVSARSGAPWTTNRPAIA